MTRIPIVTQNFASPDAALGGTPLMLLPQAPSPLPDKDQDGFDQLLLHDLHRHRQSYVRSFTAYETLKKRHDFVLRRENLRSLQRLEHRLIAKQDQYIDQSMHSYEQCFVKVVNGNSRTNNNTASTQQRPRTAAPSFNRFHTHQLSHNSTTSLEPPPLTPYHRHQSGHRLPPSPPKYRGGPTAVYRTAQSLHDAFKSSSFTHDDPFRSFAEGYLQKYGNKSQLEFKVTEPGANDDDEITKTNGAKLGRSASATPSYSTSQIGEQVKTAADVHHIRATISSRNTNTPSSTPEIGFNDAVRDGLTVIKDVDGNNSAPSTGAVHDNERRSSQQSTSAMSSGGGTNDKRPKTGKKKQVVVVNLRSATKSDALTTKITDEDLIKQTMTVQNYGTEPATRPTFDSQQLKKTSSLRQRLSNGSNDHETAMSALRQTLEKDADQVTTQIRRKDSLKDQQPAAIENEENEKIIPSNNNETQEQTSGQDVIESAQHQVLQTVDNRKRVRKGAFEASEGVGDMIAFELSMMAGGMKKTRYQTLEKENSKKQGEEATGEVAENQANLDLLEKIRQSASGVNIGHSALSQQGCRFELPFDLKTLESLTPLEYLSKYCRLSSRRNYQFKRIFDKYRNNQYRFESSNLYTAIIDIHTESFTRLQFDQLCRLIDLGDQQHQFTFDIFAGIIALCERMLYNTVGSRGSHDDNGLAKDTLERCDFDSLDRKFDGLNITATMQRLLNSL